MGDLDISSNVAELQSWKAIKSPSAEKKATGPLGASTTVATAVGQSCCTHLLGLELEPLGTHEPNVAPTPLSVLTYCSLSSGACILNSSNSPK